MSDFTNCRTDAEQLADLMLRYGSVEFGFCHEGRSLRGFLIPQRVNVRRDEPPHPLGQYRIGLAHPYTSAAISYGDDCGGSYLGGDHHPDLLQQFGKFCGLAIKLYILKASKGATGAIAGVADVDSDLVVRV